MVDNFGDIPVKSDSTQKVRFVPNFRSDDDEIRYYEQMAEINPDKPYDKVDMNDVTMFGYQLNDLDMVATGCVSDNGRYLIAMPGTDGNVVSRREYQAKHGLKYNFSKRNNGEYEGYYDPNNVNDFCHPRNPEHKDTRSVLSRFLSDLLG